MTRKAKFAEHADCLKWLESNRENNDFDPAVLDYPTCELYVAPDDEPKGCLPVHGVMMLESLGFNTDDPKERLVAALEMVQTAVERCKQSGIKEMVFLSSDARTDEFCTRVLGFREVKAFRKVLP